MKWLIIIALAITSTGKLIAQNSVGFELLNLEKEIFHAQKDTLKNEFCLKKFNLSMSHDLTKKRLLFELNRVQEHLISDTLKRLNYLWNSSLVTKLNKEFAYSNMYFDMYINESADSSDQSKILGLLIKAEIDSANYFEFLNEKVNDSSYNCMNCLHELNQYVLPHKRRYVIASTIFPGLGTMLTGDLYNGFGSLLLVPGSVYVVFNLWSSGLYFNAISWGYALIPRLYFGNTSLTIEKVKLIEKRNLNKLANQCRLSISQKLILYPINYKL